MKIIGSQAVGAAYMRMDDIEMNILRFYIYPFSISFESHDEGIVKIRFILLEKYELQVGLKY